MPDKYHPIRSIVIILLLSSIADGMTSPAELSLANRTLEDIQGCMAGSPAPWPDEWKREYVETIRKAVESHRDVTHYAVRLEILGKGFESYWGSFKKTQERSLFEVHSTRIRWYTEHLMGTKFPADQERQKLRDQYTNIWNYAAKSLIEQFPFLDPNVVQKAKAEELNECYRKIESPLMPVYLRPLSEGKMSQIKQCWDKLRYIRVDLWRRLDDGSNIHVENIDTTSSDAERDYKLTKESMSQLLGLVWKIIPQRPNYYLKTLENQKKMLESRFKKKITAQSNQKRLEKERSIQLLQTERISFLLAALSETTKCLDRSASTKVEGETSLEERCMNGNEEEVMLMK